MKKDSEICRNPAFDWCKSAFRVGSLAAATSVLLLPLFVSALGAVGAEKYEVKPVTDRAFERTGFQSAAPYGPYYDIRADFVMAYGSGPALVERLKRWKEAGYVIHVMTGIAWGGYQDYLGGKVDGRKHWDEGQVDARGRPIDHGPTVPYLVPTVSFSRYLTDRLKFAIDAGALALHLEEPEFWARAGWSTGLVSSTSLGNSASCADGGRGF